MDIFNIQALIREGKLVGASDIDPTNAYLQLGVYQEGNRKNNSANPAYPPYAIRLSDVASIGGGATNPIVRYVYLIPDASDATRMGGAAANVYTTFQTAYTEADILQTTLGGTNIVYLIVFGDNSTSDLILTTDMNPFVRIVGENARLSQVGSIMLDNPAGNSFNAGTVLDPIYISNITVGNITSQATGATGNCGDISLNISNVIIGDVINYPSDSLNTNGNSGFINIISNVGASTVGRVCNTLENSTLTGITGFLNISSEGGSITVDSIFRLNGGVGSGSGDMTLNNIKVAGLVQRFDGAIPLNTNTIKDSILGSLSITGNGSTLTIANLTVYGGGVELIDIYYCRVDNLKIFDGELNITSAIGGFTDITNSFLKNISYPYALFVDALGMQIFVINTTITNSDPVNGSGAGVVFLNDFVFVFFQGCNSYDYFGASAYVVDGDPVLINAGFFNQGSNYLHPAGLTINNFNIANDFPSF